MKSHRKGFAPVTRRLTLMICGVGALGFFFAGGYCSGALESIMNLDHLNVKDDAGPAVRSDGVPAERIVEPADRATTLTQFPLLQQARIFALGGANRGFGILASYDTAPRSFYLRRLTNRPQKEPYTPICTVRAVAPDGTAVFVKELTEQAGEDESHVFTLPAGANQPGIWRFSFAGGRNGDIVEIGLPQTATWGIRGEMALGAGKTLPEILYMYLPPTVKKIFAEKWGGKGELLVQDMNGNALGTVAPKAGEKRQLLVLENPPAAEIVRIDRTACPGDTLAFDGTPGLLCPSPEAARALAGGTLRSNDLLMAGPLQARIRDHMVALAKQDNAVTLDFPADMPADLANPQIECLFFGKYAPLSSLRDGINKQNLDPASPWLGTVDARPDLVSWETFLHPGAQTVFAALCFGNCASVQGRLNPAFGNAALVRRATLAAFYHFASLQGDDVMREGDFAYNSYPVTHAFFIYPALSEALHNLKPQLDPQTFALWSEGVQAVGDKLADFQAYQSNQWAHMIMGHLAVYEATGNPRFLGYFERLATAYLDGAFGTAAKFGQHPAGYYLEEYGPDGNYDHLNSYSIVTSYYHYRDLPEAKPELVAKFRAGIEKNLNFKKYFWLPQTDGEIVGPTAMNCRTTANIASPSFPGDHMAYPEFDLAFTRRGMIPLPQKGIGGAGTFSHLARTDDWARAVIRDFLPKKDNAFQLGGPNGGWATELKRAFTLPVTARRVTLPHEERQGVWELPGLVAFKTGKLYTVIFYDVAGADPKFRGQGHFGGGMSAVWTSETGSAINGLIPESKKVETEDDILFTCVFGEDRNGKLFRSGQERAQLTWIEPGKIFEIAAIVRDVEGKLAWRYEIGEGTVTVRVTFLAPEVKRAMLNIPFHTRGKPTICLQENTVRLQTAAGAVAVELPAGTKAQLVAPQDPAGKVPVRNVRVPLPTDGTPLVFTYRP